ncbi:polysaccharide pyruvyl transferase family protein [Hespellia stercorisuis]|uniref:Polysaccharide pyruvyl transferase n=1 Tax=Hespellia stercorisuis DSM 15480 TaxID=1121950 RepID=A0A1M6JY86_9FIRM|nr:polysaccharide pyruvyl transferase family protein [Hespellia stercorisuis]SHJ51601.1 Polysaccharide pyruvyl transferase [Hespellia stercorisuis DSM 15480]
MKKKIGIVTYLRSNNYGARIQGYAMYKVFKDAGYEVEMIDVDYPKRYYKYCLGRIVGHSASLKEWVYKYIVAVKMIRFTKRYLPATKHLITSSTDKMTDFVNSRNYDAVVCGSDEIWSSRTKEIAPPSIYFLPEKIQAKCIAFTPSANGNHTFTDAERKWLKKTFENYGYIGVRDKLTKRLVESIAKDSTPDLIFDPTLYTDFEKTALPEKLTKSRKKKIAFVFTRPHNDFPEELLKRLDTEDIECYSIFTLVKNTTFLPISPEQFTCVFQEFDIVFTNFFHGVIFSLKNQTPVLGFDTFEKYLHRESKVKDLLTRLELPELFRSYLKYDETKLEEIATWTKSVLSGEQSYDFTDNLRIAYDVLDDSMKKVKEVIDEESTI